MAKLTKAIFTLSWLTIRISTLLPLAFGFLTLSCTPEPLDIVGHWIEKDNDSNARRLLITQDSLFIAHPFGLVENTRYGLKGDSITLWVGASIHSKARLSLRQGTLEVMMGAKRPSLYYVRVSAAVSRTAREAQKYPSAFSLSNSKAQVIDLDTCRLSYKQLISLGQQAEGSELILQYQGELVLQQFLLGIVLPSHARGYMHSRNLIHILHDSVYAGEKAWPIQSLSQALNQQYWNKGRDPYMSESPERVWAVVEPDSLRSTASSIKPLLMKLAQALPTLDDSIALRLALADLHYPSRPPAPPR